MGDFPEQAVILAAGIGNRLGTASRGRPKGFLELDGLPLIVRSLRQLYAFGVRQIEIVTGYGANYYESLALQFPGVLLTYNSKFAKTNSLYSLYLSQTLRKEGFILLESDLVYEDRALGSLLDCPYPNAILMSGFTYSDDEVFISTRDNQVLRLSKNREELENVSGEMVGICKISKEMGLALANAAEHLLQLDPNIPYDAAINLVAESQPVYSHLVKDLTWAEIDTPKQLQRVQEKIFPLLKIGRESFKHTKST